MLLSQKVLPLYPVILIFPNSLQAQHPPILWFSLFIALTALVVLFGVEKGIEKVSKVTMPILAVLTVGIAIYVLTMDGAMDGLKYYLLPNMSNFSVMTVLAAMGQLFLFHVTCYGNHDYLWILYAEIYKSGKLCTTD